MKAKTDEAVINKLHYILKTRYGSSYHAAVGNDKAETKKVWLKTLRNVKPDDIGKAIEKLKQRYPKQCPDAAEFLKFVKEVKNYKPGHGSNKTWESPEMTKCNKSDGDFYLKKIRECGI